MTKTIKTFLILSIFFSFNQVGFSKPLPPGSGAGDVPANILFLLDSSASMNRQIGAGIPNISSMTIDGDGNKILSSVDRRSGGIYMFNDNGEQETINYLNQQGRALATRRWVMGPGTDNVCDFRIGTGTGLTRNFNIGFDFQFHEIEFQAGVTVGGTTINNEDLLFVGIFSDAAQPYIFALNSNMQCRLAITGGNRDEVRGFDIAMRDGVPVIYWFGPTNRVRRGAYISTCNLGAGTCADMVGNGRRTRDTFQRSRDGTRIRVDDGANTLYLSNSNGTLYGYTLPDQVNGLPVNTRTPLRECSPASRILVFGLSNTDSDIFYSGDWSATRIHKYEWTDNRTCTELAAGGTNSALANSGNPGTIDADSIRIDRSVGGIRVIGDRILFSSRSFVTELSEASFNAADRDAMWQNSIGGGRVTRWTGARSALQAVFSDGTLTSGANFGFGHWNAGQGNLGRRAVPFGGAWCHSNRTNCTYYRGWSGNHPEGQSVECTRNSCLNVGIGPGGAADAMQVLDTLGVEWGTDSEAFSQIALDYFSGPVSPRDPNSDCQLNYVIVIGDGEQTGTGVNGQAGRTADRLERLRRDFGVKTLMAVSYTHLTLPTSSQV